MKRETLINIIADSAGIEATDGKVSRYLGITSQTVRTWPSPVTYHVLRGVAGDYVRLGKKVPREIVEEMQRIRP